MDEVRADDNWDYGQDDVNWVYGLRLDVEPVFMPRMWAEHVVAYADAISVATWGELKDALAQETYEGILEQFPEYEETGPAPDEPFSMESLYAYGDGEHLPWVNRYMLDWMPAEVLEKFGSEGRSMVSGPGLFFDPDETDAVVAELERLGYTCVEDQGLVDEVCGT